MLTQEEIKYLFRLMREDHVGANEPIRRETSAPDLPDPLPASAAGRPFRRAIAASARKKSYPA